MSSTDPRPRVLVTREDPRPVVDAVTHAGGEAIALPLLVTRWLDFDFPEQRHLDDYDLVAFTSARAVAAINQAAEQGQWKWPPRPVAAAVGDRTAIELTAHGWIAECVADDATASTLADCLVSRGVRGHRVLFPCSALADTTLPRALREAGASVDVVHVYTTETPWSHDPARKRALAVQLSTLLRSGCVVTCASPSAVRAVAELAAVHDDMLRLAATPIVVIGPTSGAVARELGLQVVQADGRTLACMGHKAVEMGRHA